MDYWLYKIVNANRKTSLIAIVAGIVFLALSYYELERSEDVGVVLIGFAAFGGISFLGGLLNLIFGNPLAEEDDSLNRLKENRKSIREIDQFKRDMRKQNYPYSVCMRNLLIEKKMITVNHGKENCRKCNPAIDHIEVSSDSDLDIVIASIE